MHDRNNTTGPERILVIFPGALGDLICLFPTLRALKQRHPNASLELMAKDELGRLAVGRMAISLAHSINRREVTALFSEEADAPEHARGFFGHFAGIYSFFGFNHSQYRHNLAESCSGLVQFFPFKPDSLGHIATGYLRLFNEPQTDMDLPIEILRDDLNSASRVLSEANIEPGSYFLLLPGSGSQKKNWSPTKFVELAGLLASRGPVIVIVGPAEIGLSQTFRSSRATVLDGLELEIVAALAKLSCGFVGNDSGTSHLAAVSGARGITLFGDTDPERWRPLGEVRALRTPLADFQAKTVEAALISFLNQD